MKRTLLTTLAAMSLLIASGYSCTPTDTDSIYFNLGFTPDSNVITYKSALFETSDLSGWWSPLPPNTALQVSCGLYGSETAIYAAHYLEDGGLGYTWSETLAASNEELCAYQCNTSSCSVRRGALESQGTYVWCTKVYDEGYMENTCPVDCDYSVDGWCMVQIVDTPNSPPLPTE